MSFTWHPDRDDVYDGNLYGQTPLSGPPSAFRKDQPYSFTMKGATEDSLLLNVTATRENVFTYWGRRNGGDARVIKFDILGGTFTYKSLGALLYMGNGEGVGAANLVFTIAGYCYLEALEVAGDKLGGTEYPATRIDIQQSGIFSVVATTVGGGFEVDISGAGMMKFEANEIFLSYGSYKTRGTPPITGYSLDWVTSSPQPSASKGMTLIDVTINCQSSSTARLAAKTISLTGSDIRIEDNATMEIGTDAVTVSNSFFIMSHGSATLTFTRAGDPDRLFNYDKCPPGMFNFITTEGANTGSFRFRTGSVLYGNYIFLRLQEGGLLAINGQVWKQGAINGWTIVSDFQNPDLIISLKKA
ncbi:hypothetical protein [Phyllobacterium leguminum]|uniref:Uncharacterized protein n=1 Tax=Phyllobacterium leguminum TaxID=314237 RepID=A0A318SWF3_9HYPH|nr:hypothetical protein [Phyllobacterium leguminum]PYE86271.1 hypothetical protein C7477_1292 [Phyllobacterium leguminum]